jgi:hypothetical protein
VKSSNIIIPETPDSSEGIDNLESRKQTNQPVLKLIVLFLIILFLKTFVFVPRIRVIEVRFKPYVSSGASTKNQLGLQAMNNKHTQ